MSGLVPDLKYRKPVPYGSELTVVARVDEDLGRMFTGSGEIVLADACGCRERHGPLPETACA